MTASLQIISQFATVFKIVAGDILAFPHGIAPGKAAMPVSLLQMARPGWMYSLSTRLNLPTQVQAEEQKQTRRNKHTKGLDGENKHKGGVLQNKGRGEEAHGSENREIKSTSIKKEGVCTYIFSPIRRSKNKVPIERTPTKNRREQTSRTG